MLTEAIIEDLRPRYALSDVAAAARVPAATVRKWFERGQVSYLETDQAAEGRGIARYMSMASALRLGCMKALVDLGVGPAQANRAAIHWLDIGEGGRDPASLFPQTGAHPEALTILCAFPDGTAKVRRAPLLGISPVELLLHPTGARQPGVVLVCLNDIDRQVRSYLTGRERG